MIRTRSVIPVLSLRAGRCARARPCGPTCCTDLARHHSRHGLRPQQNIVPGATVVITDESTNVTREVQTDAEGLFEAPNLRPGTYTVTASLSGFKKVQRTGLVLRSAAVVLSDLHLEVGGLEDVVTVTAEGLNNITLESQAIVARPRRAAAARPAAQQPRHPGLPDAQSQRRRRLRFAFSSSAAAPTARPTSRTDSRRAPASSASCRMPPRVSMPSRKCRCSRIPTVRSMAAWPA